MLLPLLAGALLATPATATDGGATADLLPGGETVGFLPRGLTSFGAAVHGGYLYVLGGYFGTPHDYSIEGQSAAFLRINLHDTRDVRLLPDVDPVQSVELVPHGNTLVRVSGMNALNTADEPDELVSSTLVERFDTVTEEWSRLPDLPKRRSSHRAVVIGDTLYVAGGWDLTAGSRKAEWHADVLTLDLTNPDAGWASIDAPFQARALGAAAVDGKLVVVGGIQPDRGISTAVHVLDTATGEWSTGPEFPDFGFGITAVECGGRVLASGRSGDVHALDLAAGAWTKVADLTVGRIFHELVAEPDGTLYALGGIAGMETSGRMRAIERITLGAAADVSAIERFTIPAPCASRTGFGLAAKNRSLFLFGGNNSLDDHAFEPRNFVAESWRLDLGDLAWTRLETLPAPRQTMEATLSADGEKAFAIGGFGHDGEHAVSQATSFAYEFEFDDWVEGPALPGSRMDFGLVEHGGTMFVFGGLAVDPTRGREHSLQLSADVVSWDGASASFESTEITLPRARRAFAGGKVGDRYVLVGGMREGFAVVEEVDIYDFAAGAWTTGAAAPRARVAGECVEIDGRLYLVGGFSPDDAGELAPNPSVEVYDVEADRWTTLVDDVGADISRARALALDGKILVLTLHREGEPRAEILVIDPARAARPQ